MYNYYAWKEGNGNWGGGKLLSRSQINALKHHLPSNFEQFESVQTCDEYASQISCPLFADFDDSKNLDRARKDTITFSESITHHLGVVPDIYYSGNKGFHVILPFDIKHSRCHLLAQELTKHLSPKLKTMDQSVYRTKSLLRIPGSPASIRGRFKIKISRTDLFNLSNGEIIKRSECQQNTKETYDDSKLDTEYLSQIIAEITPKLVSYSDSPHSMQTKLTPCIKQLFLFGPEVGVGQRNRAVFVLAKFFRKSGKTHQETINLMLSQNHFHEWDQARDIDVKSVVSSVFRRGEDSKLGCKSSSAEAELLREYCDQFCIFSDDFPEINIH